MFSLNQSDEIVFQIYPPNIPQVEQDQEDALIIQQADLTHHHQVATYGFVPTTTTTTNSSSPIKRHRKKPPLLNTGHDNNVVNNNNINTDQISGKKVMHRETERLRRQEMGKLYESLRNQIPLEFIKGKRSISDHMHQAVNYINQLQRNIKELDIKRNGLKKSSGHVTSPAGNSSNNNSLGNTEDHNNGKNTHHVTVTSCWCGAEIFITSGLAEEGFQLSRVMQLLVHEQGFNVISYASTRANQRLLHTIQCEASDPTCVDISVLQQKLKDVIISG